MASCGATATTSSSISSRPHRRPVDDVTRARPTMAGSSCRRAQIGERLTSLDAPPSPQTCDGQPRPIRRSGRPPPWRRERAEIENTANPVNHRGQQRPPAVAPHCVASGGAADGTRRAGRGHHDDTDDPGGGERGEQAEGEQPGTDLGRRGDARLDPWPAHAERAEPPRRALQPAATEHLVVAVGGEEQPEDGASTSNARSIGSTAAIYRRPQPSG